MATTRGAYRGRLRMIKLGDYQLLQTIGTGAFSKVKQAVHLPSEVDVAMKIISKKKIDSSSMDKLRREMHIIRELRHPNIIRLFHVMETEEELILVTEFAKNGEIYDHIVETGKLTETAARKKFTQLASAVEYCHGQGIVHRDLKVENMLLDDDFNVKLVDFGLSNFYSRGKFLSTFCGSPPYAAPELYQRQPYEGPEVDIWSLGVILYVLVTGELPFDSTDQEELKQNILQAKYAAPEGVDPACVELIGMMLQPDRALRCTMADIRAHRWMNNKEEDFYAEIEAAAWADEDDEMCAFALRILTQVGYSEPIIINSLVINCLDDICASYNFILERLRRMDVEEWPAFEESYIRLFQLERDASKNLPLDPSSNPGSAATTPQKPAPPSPFRPAQASGSNPSLLESLRALSSGSPVPLLRANSNDWRTRPAPPAAIYGGLSSTEFLSYTTVPPAHRLLSPQPPRSPLISLRAESSQTASTAAGATLTSATTPTNPSVSSPPPKLDLGSSTFVKPSNSSPPPPLDLTASTPATAAPAPAGTPSSSELPQLPSSPKSSTRRVSVQLSPGPMSSTSLWLAAGSSIESQDGSVQVTHRAQPPRRASSISRRVIRSRKTAIPASPLYVFDRTVGFWGLLNSCGEEREETASHISEASSQRASRRPPVRHASTAADGRPVLRASLLHAQRMSMVDNGTRDFARDQLPPHSGGQPRPLLEDEADSEGHRDQQRLLRGSASYNVFPAAQDEPRDTFTANHEAPGLPITDAESEPLSFIDRRALSMMMQGDSGTAMAAGSAPKQLKATKQRVLHGSASYTAFPAGPGLPGSAQPIVNDLNSNAELDVQRGADRPGSATSTSAAVSESSSRPPWQWPEAAPTPSEPSAPTPLVTAGQMSSATTGVRNSPSQSSLGELIDRRSSSPRRSSYVPSVQMTFMDDAYLLMEALEELLRGNNIPFSEVDAFRVVVQPAPRVSLDVEVCQLPTSLYAVRFSRLFGETNQFKLWCTYILNLLAARWREQGRASALPARWSAANRVPPVPTVGYPTAQTLSDLGAPERLLVQSTSTDKAGLNADGDETTLTKSDSASSTISASSAVGTLTPTISPAAARTPRVALISPRHTSVILASSPIIDVVDSRDVSQPESASHSPSPHTSSFLVAPNEHRRAHSESSV